MSDWGIKAVSLRSSIWFPLAPNSYILDTTDTHRALPATVALLRGKFVDADRLSLGEQYDGFASSTHTKTSSTASGLDLGVNALALG